MTWDGCTYTFVDCVECDDGTALPTQDREVAAAKFREWGWTGAGRTWRCPKCSQSRSKAQSDGCDG